MDKPPSSETISPRQIEAFKAVVEAASVTRAATVMNISQPSVSRLISSLEQTIGFALFERQKGRLLPTPEAMLFYDEIQKYFYTMQRLAHTAADIRTLAVGQLRLGAFVALSIAITPAVIRRFNQTHPQMHVSSVSTQSRQIVDLITSRFADLGIVDPVSTTSAVRVERKWNFRCVCALPRGHRLAKRDVISTAQLMEENVIGLQREFLSRHAEGAALYDKLEPDLRIRVHQSIAACAIVSEGCGIAIVDPFTARHYSSGGIVVRPLEATIPFGISIISSPEAPLSVAARTFLTFFDEEIEIAMRSDPTIVPCE